MASMSKGTTKRSAGLLVHRARDGAVEVLLVHPGGPFWAKRDAGAWSIPKGELDDEAEDALAAARREFREELGVEAPAGEPVALGEVRLKSGKRVEAWAVPGDLDVSVIDSNHFETEWPPKSGRMQSFPEVDRAGWFTLEQARVKLNPAQCELLDRLLGQDRLG
jgi:predicted NUDIX family NTP pyrophosphohydrolase